jgi:PTS system cellobiose-specific IIA component
MRNEIKEDELDIASKNAMQIIMAAGDARVCCNEALSAIEENDMETAQKKIEDADKKIAEAHHIQTEAIQGEIAGEKREYNLLFAHAQDTLMTIYSEIHMTKKLIKIFESIEKRLEKLEK